MWISVTFSSYQILAKVPSFHDFNLLNDIWGKVMKIDNKNRIFNTCYKTSIPGLRIALGRWTRSPPEARTPSA